MADFSNKSELPPDERIRKIRAERAVKQQELEEELEKAREELERLESEKVEEQERSEALEEETLAEFTEREQNVKELEARIKEFSAGEEFVPEQELQETENIAATYQSQIYRTEQDISYLMEGAPSKERQREVMRSVYTNAHSIIDNFSQGKGVTQSEVYNLQQQVGELVQQRKELPYARELQNFIQEALKGDIIDYRKQDEARR